MIHRSSVHHHATVNHCINCLEMKLLFVVAVFLIRMLGILFCCNFDHTFPFTELKLYTFDGRHTTAKLSASIGGDLIQLTPKQRPAKERNGKVAWFQKDGTSCTPDPVESSVSPHDAKHVSCNKSQSSESNNLFWKLIMP